MKNRIYQIENEHLSEFAFKSKNTAGRKRLVENICEMRTDFQRDRDRIIHSKSFRRLKHKTKVFLSPEGDHYRTRLTHTLEVSQIARTVGRALALNEDLIEAIALGHDLGHTPFGHAGERTLERLTKGGFSHTKQSIRVVDVLENNGKGLNLTAEVLDGIFNHSSKGKPSTLEGKVVYYADRIAYVNHDIDDGIRAGLIHEENIPIECTKVLGNSHSARINNLVYDLVENSCEKNKVALSTSFEKALDNLRYYMFNNLYTLSTAKSEEIKGVRLIELLYGHYMKNFTELPVFYQDLINEYGLETAVCDYIASMSDRYAVKVFEDIFMPKYWSQL